MRLLPYIYKKIGLSIFILIVVAVIAALIGHFMPQLKASKIYIEILGLIAMLFIMLSKEKQEKETTHLRRQTAMVFALVSAFVFVLVDRIFDILGLGSLSISSGHLLVYVFFSYCFVFYVAPYLNQKKTKRL